MEQNEAMLSDSQNSTGRMQAKRATQLQKCTSFHKKRKDDSKSRTTAHREKLQTKQK